MVETVFVRLPTDESLSKRSGWQDLGNNMFSAIRAHLVIIKRREPITKNGPRVTVLSLPGGSEYTIQRKTARITRHADEIQRSIQETVTSKVAIEVAQKIASDLGASGVLLSAKLSSEVSAKSGMELTEAVQSTLASKRSFEVEDAEEVTRSVSYKPSSDGSKRDSVKLQFYLELWPWHWEFYLWRVEYLRLEQHRNWLWRQVRKTMSETPIEPRQLLFCLQLFEPQKEYSFTDEPYTPEVEEEGEITIEACARPHRPSLTLPPSPSLEELAKLAFPVTRQERRRVKRQEPITRRAAVRKMAAKKASKSLAKRSAASKKSAGKKMAAKKASRKGAARRGH